MRRTGSTLTLLAAVVLTAAGIAGPAGAEDQDKKWSSIQEGGIVTALVIDPTTPSRVFASTARNLFASANGGETWTPLPLGLDGQFVGALAIDPSPPAALYVGTNAGGLLRGRTGDRNWARVDQGLGEVFISAIALEPK